MSEDIELLPCPFDGGKAEFRVGGTGDVVFVECSQCAIQAEDFYIDNEPIKGYHAAANVWNRRVDSRAAIVEECAKVAEDKADAFQRCINSVKYSDNHIEIKGIWNDWRTVAVEIASDIRKLAESAPNLTGRGQGEGE